LISSRIFGNKKVAGFVSSNLFEDLLHRTSPEENKKNLKFQNHFPTFEANITKGGFRSMQTEFSSIQAASRHQEVL